MEASERDLEGLIAAACGGDRREIGLEGFGLAAKVSGKKGGRSGLFDISNRLSSDLTANVVVTLTLPEGWHVGSDHESVNDPTVVSVAYSSANVTFGDAITPSSLEDSAPAKEWSGPVTLTLPFKMKKGAVIGRYFVHGSLKFIACNDDGCLPPVEVPWSTTIVAM